MQNYQVWKLVALSAALLSAIACQNTPRETPSKTEPTTTASIKPFINPPILALNPAFVIREFEAEKGLNWTLPSGSSVKISPNSLLTKEGKPFKGRVRLKYREFRDALSIFLAGIPMTYQGGNFTTAGSFELRGEAASDNTPLSIASQKSVEVRFNSPIGGNDYDFFYLNEGAKRWDSIGTGRPELVRTMVEREKKAPTQNTLAYPLNKNYFAFNYLAILDVWTNDDWKILGSAPATDSVRNAIAPTLEAYDLGYENVYAQNIAVLFEGKEYAAPLMVWKNIDKKPFPDSLKERFGRFQKLDDKHYKFWIGEKNQPPSFEVNLECVMPLKTLFAYKPEEWKKNFNNVLATAKQEIKTEVVRTNRVKAIYRTFSVANFGLYNWDKLMKNENALIVNADFKFQTPLSNATDLDVTLITGDNLGVVTYPKNSWNKFALLNDPKTRLFAVLPNDKIALYSPKKYQAIPFKELSKKSNENNSPTFLFDMQEVVIKSESDLRKLLGI